MSKRLSTVLMIFFCFIVFNTEAQVTSCSCKKKINVLSPEKTWVFILAGQSNMAGRGKISGIDTIPNKRVLTINKDNEIIYAKEPLHFYEPSMAGVGPGFAFARELIKNIPDSIQILLIPTAVGGSSIDQWLTDTPRKGIKLYSNFLQKVDRAKQQGIIKGILWHQGESNSFKEDLPSHAEKLDKLFTNFRKEVGNEKLPIIIGELGRFKNNKREWKAMNRILKEYAKKDENCVFVHSRKLMHKGDDLHLNAESQRVFGKRYSTAFLQIIKAGF